MIVLVGLCLLSLLSGCVSTRTVYVPAPVVPISTELTADTPVPVVPDPLTWGASLDLNVRLVSALKKCNEDKAEIRRVELKRASLVAGDKVEEE
ncbi:Rz1-like lysis system protein LysC [Edwardsiella tarda]|uniref:Rz1-like lysis system protein LysC n=1 Tax=Edwardsiella tarda TaxID=636 RepID=UPI000D515947